jgi:hypothetical protein
LAQALLPNFDPEGFRNLSGQAREEQVNPMCDQTDLGLPPLSEAINWDSVSQIDWANPPPCFTFRLKTLVETTNSLSSPFFPQANCPTTHSFFHENGSYTTTTRILAIAGRTAITANGLGIIVCDGKYVLPESLAMDEFVPSKRLGLIPPTIGVTLRKLSARIVLPLLGMWSDSWQHFIQIMSTRSVFFGTSLPRILVFEVCFRQQGRRSINARSCFNFLGWNPG